MSNLIVKDERGNWGIKGLPWNKLHKGQVITREICEKLYGCLYKLMEYEDTGLSPKKIYEIDRLYSEKCRELAETKGILKNTDEFEVRLNDYAVLKVNITDQMRKDYEQCKKDAELPDDERNIDCDECSLNKTICFGNAFCEMKKIEELLRMKSSGSSI